MNAKAVLFEQQGPVAWLRLNRPDALNSLNTDIAERMTQLLPEIAAEKSVRVLVVTGVGRAFCAGADLKDVLAGGELPPGEADFLDRLCGEVFNPLRDFPKPVIAALNGITMAGGLELAMCADLVTAADSAQIGDAHANFGVYPGGGGAAVLPRLVPHNVAKYLLFTGNTLSAEEMWRHGFVNELAAADELEAVTQALAEHVALKSPIALRRMKIVANESLDKSRDDALEHEQAMLRRHMRSYDMEEGLKAFNEKRSPQFEGR